MSIEDLESRVSRLEGALAAFSEELRLAFGYIRSDAASSLTKSRMILEKLVMEVYNREMGKEPRKPLLGEMLAENQFTRKIDRRILSRMNAIRDLGNLGPHGEKVVASDASRVLDDLCEVIEWYLQRYAEQRLSGRDDSAVDQKTPGMPGESHSLIYISYSRKDESLVAPMISLLRASGQKVFVSIQNLEYGEDKKTQVAEAIRRSKRFLLFWSKSSRVSSIVGEECELALATPGCGVVPVLLDRTPLPSELERFHGTENLAPLFHALKRIKLMRRLLRLSWVVVLAIVLTITLPSVLFWGPIDEDLILFIQNLVPWLIIIFVLALILWSLTLLRSRLLYRKVVRSIDV